MEILVKILRNLNRTIETEVQLELLSQARIAETRDERTSESDHRQDEYDSNSRGDQSVVNYNDGEAESVNDVNKQALEEVGAVNENMDARQ